MRVSRDGDGVEYVMQSGDSKQLYDIITDLVPEWAILFARKNADYGSHDDSAGVLGIPGQYADIWRKMSKLKRSMWDGEELEFEKTEEVLSDLIGHLFLTLHMMRVKEEGSRAYAFATDDDSAVDAFFRTVGNDPRAALKLSSMLTPPFGELVRTRALREIEEGADESLQQSLMAQRLDEGFNKMLQGVELQFEGKVDPGFAEMIENHVSAPRDGYPEAACSDLMGEEFAEADAAQHGVGTSGDRSGAPLKAAPRRVVTEQDAGRTRYYDQPSPGSDREELALVPKRLVERVLGEHHENMGRHMDELGKWALGE